MERLDLKKDISIQLDFMHGPVNSNDKLLTRYLDLERLVGKTCTLLKMLKPK